jgi:hypothetical protein
MPLNVLMAAGAALRLLRLEPAAYAEDDGVAIGVSKLIFLRRFPDANSKSDTNERKNIFSFDCRTGDLRKTHTYIQQQGESERSGEAEASCLSRRKRQRLMWKTEKKK